MTEPETKPHFGEARRIPRVQADGDSARRLRRIDRLAWVLDQSIPIGKFRIGVDPIIGFIPGVGDWLGAVLSLYVLYEGARLGTRGPVLARMTANILIETVVGSVPVLGDLFDMGWRANSRNMALIHRHYRPDQKPRSLGGILAVVMVVALAILTLVGFLSYLVIRALIALLNG